MSLIKYEPFVSHSGINLDWKIECDALSDSSIESIAKIISRRFLFSDVYGIPRGGTRLANALAPYCANKNDQFLIVDDVYTTGRSMEEAKNSIKSDNVLGIVIFSRGALPQWIYSLFMCGIEDVG